MSIVNQFATGDEVNYNFFFKTTANGRDRGQDDAQPHILNAMKEQVKAKINSLNEQDRSTIDKLRKVSADLMSQGLDVSSVFQKFAQKGSDKISQDEMLIAMSRVSDTVQLKDVKELHRILVGASTSHEIEDVKVAVNELVQLLTL